MSSKLTLIAAALLLTSGCTYVRHIGDEDPGLGETTKYDAAAQIITPDPIYTAGGAQPGDNGAKGQAAMKRYRTDAVKAVEEMSTSSSASGGSGSGSGSSSTR